jgi:hypothetical protein
MDPQTAWSEIRALATDQGLLVMGALHPDAVQAKGVHGGTLILLGAGPAFWPRFRAAPEATDGAPDPIDRWSARVIGAMAEALGGGAYFPFGGPPYAPFIDWALKSGEAFSSPVGMLVHSEVGLMISYRGAVHLAAEIAIPKARAPSPCTSCATRPCTTACPVDALGANTGYDVARCHSHLDSTPGKSCMMGGCAARLACPVSIGAGRTAAQSALHMKAFHPT